MTREDIRYSIQKSYTKYSDDELWVMIMTGHYASISRECNEGFFAAEELIERLRNRVNKTPQEK